MMSPDEYGVRLQRAAARVTPELELIVRETMERAKDIAESRFGEQQRGWPPLAESTLRAHDGQQTPLLVTGELRESLYIEVSGANGLLASTDPKIVYSELGTGTEPPRPLLKESVRQAQREMGISRYRFILRSVLVED